MNNIQSAEIYGFIANYRHLVECFETNIRKFALRTILSDEMNPFSSFFCEVFQKFR